MLMTSNSRMKIPILSILVQMLLYSLQRVFQMSDSESQWTAVGEPQTDSDLDLAGHLRDLAREQQRLLKREFQALNLCRLRSEEVRSAEIQEDLRLELQLRLQENAKQSVRQAALAQHRGFSFTRKEELRSKGRAALTSAAREQDSPM